MRWSAEEEERLRALVADGKTSKEIAKILGRTLGSINGKRLEHRKASPARAGSAWTKADKLRVINLLHQKPLEWIAAEMGRTPHAVRTMLYREGVKCSSGRYSLRQLSDMTGLSRHTLKRARTALKGRWNTGSGKSGRMVSDEDIVRICQWVLAHNSQVNVPIRRLKEIIEEFQLPPSEDGNDGEKG